MDYKTLAIIVAIGLFIIGMAFVTKKKTKKTLNILAVIAGVMFIIGYAAPDFLPFLQNEVSLGALSVGGAGGSTGTGATCAFQPTASYVTKDKYSTTTVSGSSYYQAPGEAAVTTQPVLTSGGTFEYWVDNTTYYVMPESFQSSCSGVNVQAAAWLNSSGTFTARDAVTYTVQNGVTSNTTTLGANGRASVDFLYQPVAKASLMPFGGLFVIEYNSTIASVTCSGANIQSSNPYKLTYTTGATTRTYQAFALDSSFDSGDPTNTVRTINCQFQNGAQAVGANSPYIARLIPANYYVTNVGGDIVLDVEKALNQDTSRTGKGQAVLNLAWG